MENLPIEIQELIHEKAHRLMFADCLKDITQQDHYRCFLKKNLKEAELEYSKAWAPINRVVWKYTQFTNDKRMIDFSHYMMYLRHDDFDKAIIPIFDRLIDYDNWAKEANGNF